MLKTTINPGPFISRTRQDQVEQVLGGGVGQLAHAEVVDDEQGQVDRLGSDAVPRVDLDRRSRQPAPGRSGGGAQEAA